MGDAQEAKGWSITDDGDERLPKPDKPLSEEERRVTVGENLEDPTDLELYGEPYDSEKDGPLPTYSDQRMVEELDEAAAESSKED